MIWLINHCKLVLTDSGGLQKEAFFFNKYCITLREETEWVELVKGKYNYLAGSDEGKINSLFFKLFNKPFVKKHNYYGGGKAAYNIIQSLKTYVK
jgi:UDP-GlcNAc3NAcA epimerase